MLNKIDIDNSINIHVAYHLWFKVCKGMKRKYTLSTNALLVLNGAYLYGTYVKEKFPRYHLLKYVSYYNDKKLGEYITVLMKLGYIIESGNRKTIQLYSISDKGKEVIEEIKKNYELQLYKFYDQYS